jgi:signal transduction histidine kinase
LTAKSDTTQGQLQKLLDEQAALRRVATFVAAASEPATVFERVCAEVGSLFEVESTNLFRFEGDGTATVTGHWPTGAAPVLRTGEEVRLEGETSTVKVSRSGRPERVDEYTTASGAFVERIRAAGIASSVAAPITVAGELWGALVASSGRPHAFAPGAESRLARFAELVADALANADARERLQRLLDEQAALRRVATLVASDPQPTEVFQCVCEELGMVLGGEATNLMRFEPDGTQAFVAGWNPPGVALALPVGMWIPLEGDTALPRMRRTGRPERIDDYAVFSGVRAEMIRAAGIASAVTAPISVAGRLWGAVGAVSDSTYGFPPRTEERMASFAELVAIALANTDAREQLQRLLDEQAALRRVAVLVARGPDPTAVFERVSQEVAGLLGARAATLIRFEGAGRARALGGPLRGLIGVEVGLPDGTTFPLHADTAAGKVSRSGRPERGDDYTELRGDLGDLLRETGIASAVAAPVTVGGELWGAVVAGSERPEAFPPREEHRLAGFAELVADAVASADARQRLRKLHDEQAALRRVATLVAREPEPLEVFERVCEEVGTVLGIDGANLTRFESDGTQTVLAGWSAPGVPVFPVGGGVPLTGDAAVPRVSRSGRPERVDDYADVGGELAERIRAVGIASSVAAPITVAGKLWGAIVATAGRPHTFPPYTEQRIASFAELVAHALANVDARQQLAASRARIVEAADSERRRLERNLHDGAQQRLVSLALVLRLARADVGRDPEAARRRLEGAEAQLGQALEELRELARGIHPAVLTDRGLAAALESLATAAPLPVELEDVPAPTLPPAIEAATYYLVAEGVANAAKHARASAVTVRVGRDDRRARIEICDDGVGGASTPSGGGLSGLADRVEALGGRLEIVSPPTRGTSLVAEIPFAPVTTAHDRRA